MDIFDKYDLVDVDDAIEIPEMPKAGKTIIFGSSGSGKSTILKDWGMRMLLHSESDPIHALFSSDEVAERFLISAGLRSIPCWKRSLSEVSNGERHRAEVALSLSIGELFIDEFTSLVDRDTARSLCASLNKVKSNLVLASCHSDILEWVDFDQAYNTDTKEWIDRGSLRRDREIKIELSPCDAKEVWSIFGKYHYLSGKINKSCNAWVATINGNPVAMTSVIAFPNANWKNGWREHRTVVLPEFQGLGIGSSISNSVAKHIASTGGRFFSKTSHPAMGAHREKSINWKPTSKNKVIRNDYKSDRKTKEDGHKLKHMHRSCFSHEYVITY